MVRPGICAGPRRTARVRPAGVLPHTNGIACVGTPRARPSHLRSAARAGVGATLAPAALHGSGAVGGGGSGVGTPRGTGGGGGRGDEADRPGRHGWRAAAAVLCAQLVLGVVYAPASRASNEHSHGRNSDIAAFSESWWGAIGPLLQNLGLSGILGAAVAAVVKFAGRLLAVCVGLLLAVVQVLSHYGYVTIHWDKLQADVQRKADLNRDGAVNNKDVPVAINTVLNFLAAGVPDVAGFVGGFALGLRLL